MVHQFATFEIDESQRELRAGGHVIRLQPRIFDLLVYLVRNRDRVVPKDELLDSVWPGVIVSEGSLQRAISLARTALASTGAPDAIRTFPRHGYRFIEPGDGGMPSDWGDRDADELHRWTYEMHFAGQSQEALDELERVVARQRALGDLRGAAWACILIGQLRLERRELVIARGWHRHAVRLLESCEAVREQGHADLLGFRLSFFENEPARALEFAERAREAGSHCGDASLEGLGLLGMGEANLMLGQTRQGLDALDEAGAAVVAGGMSTWSSGLVYCGVIYCCMTRSDWNRASQWTEQFDRWSADKGALGYPGLCRLHRAEVLAVRGKLGQAEEEMQAAHESLARSSPWMEGEIWRVIGDIHTAKGDIETARSAYEHAISIGSDTQFELAQLRLLEGDAVGAAESMRQLLEARVWSCQAKIGLAWTRYAIASSFAGNPASARAALDKLTAESDLVATPALQALVTCARAELEVAEGRAPSAVPLLRSALAAWLEMDAPLAAAHARCRLGRLLLAQGDDALATLEHTAAKAEFERAGAIHALKRCDELFQMENRVRNAGAHQE